MDGIRVARCGIRGVEAEDAVGIGLTVGAAVALGRQEGGGGGVEFVGARGVGIGG